MSHPSKKNRQLFFGIGIALLLLVSISSYLAFSTKEPVYFPDADHSALIPSTDHPSLAHIREKMEGNEHFTIVALGDSNTEVNYTSEGYLNWLGLMQVALNDGGYRGRNTVINAGIGGDAAAKAINRLERDVLRYEPDLVIITFASNDWNEFTPQKTESAMREIIQRVRDSGASILIRTVQPNFHEKSYVTSDRFIATIDAVRRAANAEEVALLDHFALWQLPNQPHESSYYRFDYAHPNQHGHRRLYAELAPVLGLKETMPWEED